MSFSTSPTKSNFSRAAPGLERSNSFLALISSVSLSSLLMSVPLGVPSSGSIPKNDAVDVFISSNSPVVDEVIEPQPRIALPVIVTAFDMRSPKLVVIPHKQEMIKAIGAVNDSKLCKKGDKLLVSTEKQLAKREKGESPSWLTSGSSAGDGCESLEGPNMLQMNFLMSAKAEGIHWMPWTRESTA